MYPDEPPIPYSDHDFIVASMAGNAFPLNVVRDLLRPVAEAVRKGKAPPVLTALLQTPTVQAAESILAGSGGPSHQ
jgi:tRNA U38,U39,U40 pseudouridine synthase TruA